MNDIRQDIVFAWRSALKKPGTSLLIIVTLALGIGANTAIFSMTWHVLLAPLPYADRQRLVALVQNETGGSRKNFGWSNPTLRDFRAQNTVFSNLLEYNQYSLTFVGTGTPYHGYAGLVTGNFFEMLGVQPQLGRLLNADDDRPGADPVIMLAHEFWLGKFAGDRKVIGATLEMQHSNYRIVGVLPPLPAYPHANDVWIPAASNPYDLALGSNGVSNNRGASVISRVIGKLHEGVTFDQAGREADLIAKLLAASYPDDYRGDYTVAVKALKDEMTRDSAATIFLLMALALLVVLIAGANVANLSLVRTMARNQELAIREAVGASPGRITRQLFTESFLLALAGGALGLLIAWPCLNMLRDFATRYTPLASEISMDGAVLVFAFGLSLVAGIMGSAATVFGQRDINKALKEGGDKVTTSASGTYRRNALLVVQSALAFVMLTVSILILVSLWRLNRQDPGFELDQVFAVKMIINVDLSEPELISEKMRIFGRDALTAVGNIPEVTAIAIRGGSPLLEQVAFESAYPFEVEGMAGTAGESAPAASINMISESYFTIMGIPLLEGRPFAETDDAGAVPVVIVNENFAKRYFPQGKAMGGNIRLRGRDDWHAIVGVVADVRSTSIDAIEGPAVYFSYWQFGTEGLNLYVKSAANPAALSRAITAAVHALDPRQSVSIKPLTGVKADGLAPARLRATLISLFGALALVVTLSGVMGAASYNVSQRVREIGIHMAVGASPARVRNLFIREGFAIYFIGWLLGLLLMMLSLPALEPLLYSTSAFNVPVLVASTMLLTLAMLVAMYIPARKAGAMQPVEALHHE